MAKKAVAKQGGEPAENESSTAVANAAALGQSKEAKNSESSSLDWEPVQYPASDTPPKPENTNNEQGVEATEGETVNENTNSDSEPGFGSLPTKGRPSQDQIAVVKPRKKRNPKALKWLLLIIVIAGIVGAGYWWYRHHHQSKNQNDVNVVKVEIARHMLLPTNEQPVMQIVADKSKASPLLARANNGDRVLIYVKNQRLIIYRPSIDRIIDVLPVQIQR